MTHLKPWEFHRKNEEGTNTLLFGLNLNQDNFLDKIEMGPDPNTPEAADFREFWEELATLRRFKDGTICEAVYFEANTMQDRRHIYKKIIEFVLTRKLNVNYKIISDEFESVLELGVETSFEVGTCEEPSLKIKTVYDEFSKLLRELKMPLPVTTVQGLSDVFSYTEVFPPLPTSVKDNSTESFKNCTIISGDSLGLYVQPIECVFQLAQHSKWPTELGALRNIITEFYFLISSSLKEQHGINCKVTESYLDVFYRGLVFRLRMYQQKEIILLKKNFKPDGVLFYRDNEESLYLEYKLNVLPRIQGALNG